MKLLARDLFLLRGFPPFAFNCYWMGGILVDAGTRFAGGRILRQLRDRPVYAHALTHAHPDHQGSSHRVCEALGIPLWCGEADAEAVEDSRLIVRRLPDHWFNRRIGELWTGPSHPVARRLRDGDEVEGFRVVETPGHCAGHISFWRADDRVLVMGDVLARLRPGFGGLGLCEPPKAFTPDPELNRHSARKLAALEPALIAFGHGPPLRDPKKLAEFVARWDEGR